MLAASKQGTLHVYEQPVAPGWILYGNRSLITCSRERLTPAQPAEAIISLIYTLEADKSSAAEKELLKRVQVVISDSNL